MIFAIYFFIAAFIFLLLGAVWDKNDIMNLIFKIFFFFLAAWGLFFALLSIRGLYV